MRLPSSFVVPAIAAVWAASLLVLWPETVLSGYAGDRDRLETAARVFRAQFPYLQDECRMPMERWIRASARLRVASGLPTGNGYLRTMLEAESDYAAAGCRTGPFLVADTIARLAGDDVRAEADLPGSR